MHSLILFMIRVQLQKLHQTRFLEIIATSSNLEYLQFSQLKAGFYIRKNSHPIYLLYPVILIKDNQFNHVFTMISNGNVFVAFI